MDAPENNDVTPVAESEIETVAKANRWIPKEQFKGDMSKWRSASEYMAVLDKRQLLDHISKQNANVSELKNQVEQLTKLMTNAAQHTATQTLEQVDKERREAAASGDMKRFDDLDKKVYAFKREMDVVSHPKIEPMKSLSEDEMVSRNFMEENSNWHEDMKDFAAQKDAELAREIPSVPVKERLKIIKELTLNRFPITQKRAPNMESQNSTRTAPIKEDNYSFNELPRQFQEVIERAEQQFPMGQIPKDFRKNTIKQWKEDNQF